MALNWNSVEPSQRVQYLNFVFYDEAKLELLKNLHIPFCWILHDRDESFEDEVVFSGQKKKAHFHVLMDYGNTTTVRYWKKLLEGIPANDYAEITASPRGYFRYLIHADDPNKFQYDPSDRHEECGFSEFELLSKTDTNFIIRWVNHFIIEHGICEYDDLILALDDGGLFCESTVVYRNTIHFTNFLKSRRIKKSVSLKRDHDKEVGLLPTVGEGSE